MDRWTKAKYSCGLCNNAFYIFLVIVHVQVNFLMRQIFFCEFIWSFSMSKCESEGWINGVKTNLADFTETEYTTTN